MSFFAAVASCFRRYATFTGRASRSEFWWFVLFIALSSSVVSVFNGPSASVAVTNGSIFSGPPLTTFWTLATLLPTLAVMVRRLNDTGRSWYSLFWMLVPVGGLLILVIFWTEPSRYGVLPRNAKL